MFCEKDLFGKAIISNGNISSRCEMTKVGSTIIISVDGGTVYQYEQTDRVTMRLVWVEVYEGGFATYKEISKKINVSATTLKGWVKRFRKYGSQGLFDKVGRGRKRKIDAQLRTHILHLRSQRKSMNEIARICSCSNASVCNIINEHKNKNLSAQKQLDLNLNDKSTEKDIIVSANIDNDDISNISESDLPTNSKTTSDLTEPISSPEIQGESNLNETNEEFLASDEVVLLNDELEELKASDRSADRTLASLGELYDAPPLFTSNKHLECAGIFMAFVILANDPFLKIGMNILLHPKKLWVAFGSGKSPS